MRKLFLVFGMFIVAQNTLFHKLDLLKYNMFPTHNYEFLIAFNLKIFHT